MTEAATALHAFSGYGIELEYMIVDRDSLDALPLAGELLRTAAGEHLAELRRGRFTWSNEVVLHVLEISNSAPEPQLAGLAAGFQAEIEHVEEQLARYGARLMSGAMHPWLDPKTQTRLWPHQDAAIYRTYDRIFDCRAHGWANIQSMHLNLPFAGDEEFARVHAATRLLLPILPALAASSPVADGRAREALDFRMESYRFHPARVPSLIGHLVPDNAASRAEYEAAVLAPMYRDIAPLDPEGVLRHEWLNARGAIPRFDRNALEIRVIDVQECPRADLAVAALAGAAARALYDGRWAGLATQRRIETAALGRILLACIRDAERAVIDDAGYLAQFGYPRSRCEAHELWRHLRGACAADPLLREVEQGVLDTLLDRGPLARRLLRALGPDFDSARLKTVYRELCDCLAAGRLFLGPDT